ncbi:MAG: nitrite/sulfite reductase [Armatimonadota bacterium]
MSTNKMEDVKKLKDGLDVIDDINRYAVTGYETINPDDMDLFKWYGVYQQKPRDGHFMVRVKVSGGHYTSDQLRVLAGISHEFGRDLADITTRQTYQFHWLTIQDIPEVLRRLDSVGMSTIGACGDIMRNITGCPVAGCDCKEVFDAQPDLVKVNEYFLGRKEFSNLPRKFKLSISACDINCIYPQINCLSFVGVPHGPEGVAEEGYNIYVGGGLSTAPHFAKAVDIFITRDQILDAAIAMAEIFRDHGGRERRTRARLKFLMDDWGPERFREEIAERLSFEPHHASPHKLRDQHKGHMGVFPQKQTGLNYIGVTVPIGRVNAQQMFKMADIADKYGQGRLANTIQQNFIIFDVPDQSISSAVQELRDLGFAIEEMSAKTDCVTCTGNEFCNLAVTETKNKMAEVISYLDQNVTWDRHIIINMNGCPNGCGHHWIADIGLQGASTRVGGETVECYDFHVGGGLGEDPAFVRKVARRIGGDEIHIALANVIKAYQSQRKEGETFREWATSISDEEIAAQLGVVDVKLRKAVTA